MIELPADPAAFVSPLSTFRTYTKDQADEVQLTVTGLPAGARLRLAALDAYDGRQFTAQRRRGTVRPDRAGSDRHRRSASRRR